MNFKLISPFTPTGDQPLAIKSLVKGLNNNEKYQTLLGVTGSGKTFTIANVIEQTQRPTIVLSHNKTLAAQLYQEFKTFFPNNAVEYFVSYYDYYQPEAYLAASDTFIEKDLSINEEIEKLRLSATSALMSGRRDVIIISSVSCIYGIGNPEDFKKGVVVIEKNQSISRNSFLHKLVENMYSRTSTDFKRGSFRVTGDTIDIFLAYADYAVRVSFWGDEIESIYKLNPINNNIIEEVELFQIFPANIFVTNNNAVTRSINEIQFDLLEQIDFLKKNGLSHEAKRLKSRVEFDIEMMRELGYCSGIENYSRYFDRRKPGDRPFCLIDYFPEDYLMVIDESHVSLPQIKAMYGGDRSRKTALVDYGFRLPAALDNRPLRFDEFESMQNQVIYVSATPSDYELNKTEGVIVEQLIRPTGLLDPQIIVNKKLNQIDDLVEQINNVILKDERILVTTLTKRMAEELDKYLSKLRIRCRYIHSDVDTLDRVEIISGLRKGIFDVLIGVNLLREGLDLPEVSLIAILDADKEGFLRSERALVQTVGRAARNINGRVIMYADKMTDSMKRTINETNRRRDKQQEYNIKHNITPKQVEKEISNTLLGKTVTNKEEIESYNSLAEDPIIKYMSRDELETAIKRVENQMKREAKKENFIEASYLRDELFNLKKILLEN